MKTIITLTLLALVLLAGCGEPEKSNKLCPSGICNVIIIETNTCIYDLNSSWYSCVKHQSLDCPEPQPDDCGEEDENALDFDWGEAVDVNGSFDCCYPYGCSRYDPNCDKGCVYLVLCGDYPYGESSGANDILKR